MFGCLLCRSAGQRNIAVSQMKTVAFDNMVSDLLTMSVINTGLYPRRVRGKKSRGKEKKNWVKDIKVSIAIYLYI